MVVVGNQKQERERCPKHSFQITARWTKARTMGKRLDLVLILLPQHSFCELCVKTGQELPSRMGPEKNPRDMSGSVRTKVEY